MVRHATRTLMLTALLYCANWPCCATASISEGNKVLTIQRVPLMDKDRVMTSIAEGTELLVERKEGRWCLVTVSEEGRRVAGWVTDTALTRMPSTSERVWLISTRDSCRIPGNGENPSQYYVLGADHQFYASSAEVFARSDLPDVPTIFFVHGNRTDRYWAVRDGWRLYQLCKRQANGRAFRFVIWSWPADRIGRRNRPDVQIKASRADLESLYLAKCLAGIDDSVPVSLVGHSFGARAIAGALDLLGGGKISGRTLSQTPQPRTVPVRVALVAAAMNSEWLSPGRRNGNALQQAEGVLVTRNMQDSALRWYPRLYGRGGPDALGFVGPTCMPRLGEYAKLKVVALECEVGRNHDWASYFGASALTHQLSWYTFLDDGTPPRSPVAGETDPTEFHLSAVSPMTPRSAADSVLSDGPRSGE